MVSIDFCKAFVGLHNGKILKKPTKSYFKHTKDTMQLYKGFGSTLKNVLICKLSAHLQPSERVFEVVISYSKILGQK